MFWLKQNFIFHSVTLECLRNSSNCYSIIVTMDEANPLNNVNACSLLTPIWQVLCMAVLPLVLMVIAFIGDKD